MTIQDIYEAVLIELNKVQAPSILLRDFVYFYNKAVQQYINLRYNLFETTQQLTDDLRVLLKPAKIVSPQLKVNNLTSVNDAFGSNYSCDLPDDYMHILNCICQFKDTKPRKCAKSDIIIVGANKLDTKKWSQIFNSYYMQPSIKRPYFYIINNYPGGPKPGGNSNSMFDRTTSGIRYGNRIQPVMQIKYGDDSRYKLDAVWIDYICAPEFVKLDEDDLDSIADQSALIEFPDYVVYEVINIIVKLILENQGNQRLQTEMIVNNTIGPMGQSK